MRNMKYQVNEPKEVIYYEVHVTIEPVEDERLKRFEEICKEHKFRVANLIMVKNRKVTDERSNRDQFCTGRFSTYTEAFIAMNDLNNDLVNCDFQLWRSKIESVLYDWRLK